MPSKRLVSNVSATMLGGTVQAAGRVPLKLLLQQDEQERQGGVIVSSRLGANAFAAGGDTAAGSARHQHWRPGAHHSQATTRPTCSGKGTPDWMAASRQGAECPGACWTLRRGTPRATRAQARAGWLPQHIAQHTCHNAPAPQHNTAPSLPLDHAPLFSRGWAGPASA